MRTTLLSLLLIVAAAASAQTFYETRVAWAQYQPARADEQRNPAIRYELRARIDGAAEVTLAELDLDAASAARDSASVDVAFAIGQLYEMRVVAYDVLGQASAPSDTTRFMALADRGGGENPLPAPAAAQLEQNRPNPFNPSTSIVYGVPADVSPGTQVALEIYNMRGQRIRSFQVDSSPGFHDVLWDGTDDHGNPQSTGLYLTRFACGDRVETRKMTMVK